MSEPIEPGTPATPAAESTPALPERSETGPTCPDNPASELLTRLFGGGPGDDFGQAAPPPLHWPSLSGDEMADEMAELYPWVVKLQHRFAEMMRVPACWYRHNGLVELLSALRDHERACFTDTAAPTAGVAWHMAFRDIETRLRLWISELRCGGDPNYHDSTVHAVTLPATKPPADLAEWIEEVQHVHEAAAIAYAVAD